MNNHKPHTSAPSTTCSRMELILPVLEDGGLDAITTAAAREHLRTCAHCRREHERYAALDQALRGQFGFSSVRPRTTEEIMQHINEREQADQSTQSIQHSVTPPSAPGGAGSRRFVRFNRSWLSGLGAVAVVVVLLGMAAVLFSGRLGLGGVGSYGGPPRYTFANTKGIFADVSMVSPTEGWALAKGSQANTVAFYHYLNGTWSPVRVTLSASATSALKVGGPGGFNGTISMDSATDGWALASNFNRSTVLFHFTSGQWQEVQQGAPSGYLSGVQALSPHSVWVYSNQPSLIAHYDGSTWTRQTLSGMSQQSRLVTVQMVSDTLGWAAFSPTGDYGNANYTVMQYAGNNTWNTHSSINAGKLGDISGLAMVSPDEGWAFGSRSIDGPSGVTANKPVQQVLYHYSNGTWQNASVTFDGGISFVTLEKIVMRSAHDGWIIAQDQNQRPGITASGIERHTILLYYDGSSWKQVQTPNTGGDASMITGMSFSGDSGWACGYIAALPGNTIQDSDIPSFGSPMLWQYSNGEWVLYQQK